MTTPMDTPEQAVILAGGRGTRLKPLTNSMPKPMIPFYGKPFLEYLLEQLKHQGIKKVLLLLGYMPYKICDYFGGGGTLGLQIEYSITDVGDETGRRIKLARDKLDSCFLLMYCDNYWPMTITKMWEQFVSSEAIAQITAYSNKDHYTRNNMQVNRQGLVMCYDKNRRANNLNCVEIGYALMQKEVVDFIPDGNVNFEKTVYPVLVEKGKLFAYRTDHRYYSIGSHERLPLTNLFFRRRPAIILDRDGVLNKKPPKAHYVKKWNEFQWLPGAIEAIRLLKSGGYVVIIVTNQAGIARGMMTESDLASIHRQMKAELAQYGASIDAIYYCPHGWDDGCECRKPKPGMLFQAQRDFHLDLSRTFFIGDDERDEQAGEAAGCPTLLVAPNISLLHLVKNRVLKHRTPSMAANRRL